MTKGIHGYGPHSAGMQAIIDDVHKEVDAHRARNGQSKWNWSLKSLVREGIREFPRTGWIATISMFMAARKKTNQ